MLASSVHKSMLAFIAIPLLYVDNKKNFKTIKVFVVSMFVFCLYLVINGKNLPFMEQISKIPFLAHKFDKYFVTKTRWGFVLPLGLQVINMVVAFILMNALDRIKKISKEKKDTKVEFCKVCYWVILYSSFALPLIMLHEEFIRYFRNCNILIYIMAAIVLFEYNKRQITKFKLPFNCVCNRITLLLVLLLSSFIWLIVYSPNNVISYYFTNNQFLSGYHL